MNGTAFKPDGLWNGYRYVVNAVLLKLRPELYQSRYNQSAIKVKQDTIHTATIP